MEYRKHIIIIGILLLACSSFFYKVMFDDYILFSGDSLSAQSVNKGIEDAHKFDGEYPYWLPWIYSGVPSTHSMQNISDYYYPHHVISIIKDTSIPWVWNFIIHLLFCGFGMYLFLRNLKLDYYSAIFGSITFMIMPWMVVMIVHGHGSQVMTATYIPWVLWALIRIKEK